MNNKNTDIILSICTPTYNRREELRRCIDSVLGQNYDGSLDGKIEMIIQNNASDDGTKELGESYASGVGKGIVKFFSNPKNIGLRLNMVEVLKNARGKYVLYITDDDYMLPGSIKSILDFISKNDYDFIRLNCISFLEKSVVASCNFRIKRVVDTNNITLDEKAQILIGAQVLTGNILKREKIDVALMTDIADLWYAHLGAIAKLLKNVAYVPYVYIIHTWENKLFWDNKGVANDSKQYDEVRHGLFKTFLRLENVLGADLVQEILGQLSPVKSFYPDAYKRLTFKQKAKIKIKNFVWFVFRTLNGVVKKTNILR